MESVRDTFKERVAEIADFISFIEQLDPHRSGFASSSNITSSITLRSDLSRTMKASVFLLLYNLMESTVINAVIAIFDELESTKTSYDHCRKEIQTVILKNLKRHKPQQIQEKLLCISTDIITSTFKKDEILSGNVDAREIRNIATQYGFVAPHADGQPLLAVKTNRNDLAHGSKSFSEVGRDHSIEDILNAKEKVILYLEALLTSVEDYINQKKYIKGTA